MFEPIAIVDAAATLPNPPVSWAVVDATALPKEFDLEVWANAASDLEGLELLGAVGKPKTIVDDDIDTVDFANDELDISSHAYKNGDGPLRLTTSDTLPTGLALETNYWVIVVNSGTIQLASSLANALAGTAVEFTDAGEGTHTIVDTDDTERLRWMSFGLIGHAGDGEVSLAADSHGYSLRINHRPPVLAYALAATSVSAAVSAAIRLFSRRG